MVNPETNTAFWKYIYWLRHVGLQETSIIHLKEWWKVSGWKGER